VTFPNGVSVSAETYPAIVVCARSKAWLCARVRSWRHRCAPVFGWGHPRLTGADAFGGRPLQSLRLKSVNDFQRRAVDGAGTFQTLGRFISRPRERKGRIDKNCRYETVAKELLSRYDHARAVTLISRTLLRTFFGGRSHEAVFWDLIHAHYRGGDLSSATEAQLHAWSHFIVRDPSDVD
jgi:hypothetical protein